MASAGRQKGQQREALLNRPAPPANLCDQGPIAHQRGVAHGTGYQATVRPLLGLRETADADQHALPDAFGQPLLSGQARTFGQIIEAGEVTARRFPIR